MRQAIYTKYLGPGNVRGSRVKAQTSSGLSLTIEWRDELDTNGNHRTAAMLLARKLNWAGRWVPGGPTPGPTGWGCVFVQDDDDHDAGFVIFRQAAAQEVKAELQKTPEYQAADADSRARAQAAVDAVFGYVPEDPKGVR